MSVKHNGEVGLDFTTTDRYRLVAVVTEGKSSPRGTATGRDWGERG